jgi:hypothetical protein
VVDDRGRNGVTSAASCDQEPGHSGHGTQT